MKKQLTFLSLLIISLSARTVSAGPLENLLNELNSIKKTFESAASGATTKQSSPSINQNDSSEDLFGNAGKSTSSAVATPSSKIVEATGVGETLDLAKEDAIRQAVQKAVGSYVSSDLITKNDDVIKDKVISLSAGFVEKTEITSQNKREDGLFETKIKATVTSTKLRRALEDQNIATTDLDSESLFGEALTKLDNTNSTLDLWAGMMKKFPQSAVRTVLIGKPKIDSIKDDDVLMTFTTLVGWEPKFRDEFISVMKNTGDIIIGKHDTLLDLGYKSSNRPVSLNVVDKILEKQIYQLIRNNTKSLSINLHIKNSAGEVVRQISNCLSKGFYYKKDPTNPFIGKGINVYGFPYEDGHLDIYSSRYHIQMKQDYEDRKFWLEAKDSDGFYLHVKEVVKRDMIKEFKAVDIVIGDCPTMVRN